MLAEVSRQGWQEDTDRGVGVSGATGFRARASGGGAGALCTNWSGAASPILTEIYRKKDRAVLKEDLRTATFVLRPTTEEKHFRFAHTSLQEYFLAAYLARALLEGKLERWDMPRVSRETLDFLGQILALEPQIKVALRSLETLLGGETLRAAVLAFDYWLVALEHGHPVPAPSRVKLTGANLEEWHIRGRSPTQPLNLRRADLTNVRLNRARLEHVELADADLTGLQARQALFLNVSAPRARASGVDFAGLRWREGSLEGAELRGARLDDRPCRQCHRVRVESRWAEGAVGRLGQLAEGVGCSLRPMSLVRPSLPGRTHCVTRRRSRAHPPRLSRSLALAGLALDGSCHGPTQDPPR